MNKKLLAVRPKATLEKTKKQQEIGDNLSVCVINLLSVVSTLPRLVAISL